MIHNQNFWKGAVRQSAVLTPVDRIAEVLFGVIMVLTFTGAISAATTGRDDLASLLWAALGCNVAWGFVDAIMYLMNIVVERGHQIKVIAKLNRAKDAEESRRIFKDEIQPVMAALLEDEEMDRLVERLKKIPEPSAQHLITAADLIAGLQIFLLVFLCTFPVALPFLIFKEVGIAMRASNGVALGLLFLGGWLLAEYAGFRRFATALVYGLIGVLLVALTMALGG
ncbi:MAG TPA: hypothetical protein VG737_15640 [Cyclobacteriaceae bacterium]|nr:hypothetical protein [Cyclobacteriaceae bacterium]